MPRFPSNLKYIFNPTDPKSGRTVVLFSFGTLTARTLKKKKIKTATGAEKYNFWSKYKGVFGTVIVDEAQRLVNMETFGHQAVMNLSADSVFYLTGTPVVNSVFVGHKKIAIFFFYSR